jgi:hypothetical protein
MAALNEGVAPRKRIMTYGKSARKRPPQHIQNSTRFEAPEDPTEDVSVSHKFHSTVARSPDVFARSSSSPAPAQSVMIDVFDVPSSDEEPANTPRKRRRFSPIPTKLDNKKSFVDKPLGHGAAKAAGQAMGKGLTHSLPEGSTGRKLNADTSQMTKTFLASGVHLNTQHVASMDRHPKPHSRVALGKEVKTGILPMNMVHRNAQPADMGDTPLKLDPGRVIGQELKTKVVHAKQKQQAVLTSQNRNDRATKAASFLVRRPTTPRKEQSSARMDSTPFTPGVGGTNPKSAQSPPQVLTPKGMEMWNGLLGDSDDGTFDGRSPSSESTRHVSRVSGRAPRRRLIDSLVEQSKRVKTMSESANDSESGGMSDSKLKSDSDELPMSQKSPSILMMEGLKDGKSLENTKSASLPMPPGNSQSSQGPAPRITYSRQRSMLAEHDLTGKMNFDIPLLDSHPTSRSQRRGSLPKFEPLRPLHEQDGPDETQKGGAIRTVHELRQAGANNRFTDEVEDLLDRIGSPGKQVSLRRSALLELADKMTSKDFLEKFTVNGMDQRLFINLGQDTDAISGFLMILMLSMVLDTSFSPSFISHLRQQGITRLLIRLIDVEDSVIRISKDRKTNMSKLSQTSLATQHAAILKLHLWEGMESVDLSPRLGALQCLELMVRKSREAGNLDVIISRELSNKLFAILKATALQHNISTTPGSAINIQFKLLLSVLESHSLKVIATSDDSTWVGEYLPIIRDTLQSVLIAPFENFGVMHILILRLTLNVTNNNPSAANVFATPELMLALGCCIFEKFQALSRFLVEDERLTLVDHLVLMLGVMINFAEWSIDARQCFNQLQNSEKDPLFGLVKNFLDNLDRVSEVSPRGARIEVNSQLTDYIG